MRNIDISGNKFIEAVQKDGVLRKRCIETGEVLKEYGKCHNARFNSKGNRIIADRGGRGAGIIEYCAESGKVTINFKLYDYAYMSYECCYVDNDEIILAIGNTPTPNVSFVVQEYCAESGKTIKNLVYKSSEFFTDVFLNKDRTGFYVNDGDCVKEIHIKSGELMNVYRGATKLKKWQRGDNIKIVAKDNKVILERLIKDKDNKLKDEYISWDLYSGGILSHIIKPHNSILIGNEVIVCGARTLYKASYEEQEKALVKYDGYTESYISSFKVIDDEVIAYYYDRKTRRVVKVFWDLKTGIELKEKEELFSLKDFDEFKYDCVNIKDEDFICWRWSLKDKVSYLGRFQGEKEIPLWLKGVN